MSHVMGVDFASGPSVGVVYAHHKDGTVIPLPCTSCGRSVNGCGHVGSVVTHAGTESPECWSPKGVAAVWSEG